MSKPCVVDECPGNSRKKKRGEKLYYFKAREDQLKEWSNAIPGNKEVQLHDKVCSRHFNDEDLIKEWNFVINDKTITMPRGRWTLKIGAVPAIFDHYQDAAVRPRKHRKSKPSSFTELGSSSSDEEAEPDEPRRKRRRKSKRTDSPKLMNKCSNRAPETPKANAESSDALERCVKPNDLADATWENVCDNFVDQLNSLGLSSAHKLDATKRGRGRPRKHPIRAKGPLKRGRGRPPKVKPVLPTPPRSEVFVSVSEAETEDSVIIEHFVASGCDSDWECRTSESGGEPVKRRGSSQRKYPPRFSKLRSAQSVKSNSEDVVILNESDCSFPNIAETLPEVTVKTEKCDVKYRNCHCDDEAECSCDTSNEWNCDGVVVKREICECKGENAPCCELQQNSYPAVLEAPSTPILSERTYQAMEALRIDSDSQGSANHPEQDNVTLIEEISITPATAQSSSAESSSECVPTPQCGMDRENQRSLSRTAHKLPFPPEQHTESLEIYNDKRPLPTSTESDDESCDAVNDFLGFSSGEEDDLLLRRNILKDSAGMALKSTTLYFSKQDMKRNLVANKLPYDSSLLKRRPAERERKLSMEIAIDQLNSLCNMEPASLKLSNQVNRGVVQDRASKIQDGKFTGKNESSKDTLVKFDEVFKYGRISDEVTLTKASNVDKKLDKVTSIKSSSTLDKVTPSHPLKIPAKASTSYDLKAAPSHSKTVGTSTTENHLRREKIPTSFSAQMVNGSSLDRILSSTKGFSFSDPNGSVGDPTVDKTSVILKNFKSDGVLALECVVLKEQVRQLQKELFLHKQLLIDCEHNASLLQRRLELQAQLPCANCANFKRSFVGKETLI